MGGSFQRAAGHHAQHGGQQVEQGDVQGIHGSMVTKQGACQRCFGAWRTPAVNPPAGRLADNPAMTLNRFVQPERALALAVKRHTEARLAAAAETAGGAFVQAVQLMLSGSGRWW